LAEFNSIESVNHTDEASIIAEIQCFLAGEFRLSEIPFERENLSESFIEFVRDNGSGWDSPEYYMAEPETCFQEARLFTIRESAVILDEFSSILNGHYPFEFSGSNSQVMKRKDNITPVGLAYIWLRIYILSVSPNNYMQFDDSAEIERNHESKIFHTKFTKVFEYLSAFAISGRFGNATWMTAQSRSARDYLEILEGICTRVNQGRVKQYDDLAPNHKNTNDGRTDMITITMRDNDFQADSEIYLTQATIQKDNLKSKVVNTLNRDFFNGFFALQLTFAKTGVLVVPHKLNALLQSECGLANCVYMHLALIFDYLGDVAINDNLTAIGEEFAGNYSNLEDQITLQRFT